VSSLGWPLERRRNWQQLRLLTVRRMSAALVALRDLVRPPDGMIAIELDDGRASLRRLAAVRPL